MLEQFLFTHVWKTGLNTTLITCNHINHVPLGGWIVVEADSEGKSLSPLDVHGPYEYEDQAIRIARQIEREILELLEEIDGPFVPKKHDL